PQFEYAIQLWAGNTLLASASNLALAANTFGSDSAIYSSGAADPSAGVPLTIVLTTTGTGGQQTEAFFDQVTLDATSTSTAGAPEPSTLALSLLALLGLTRLASTRSSVYRKGC